MTGGTDSGTAVRSLREVFASFAHGSADPAAALAQAGHGDLPGHLVTEAIISYADSAPVEVAEHLSPYVVAHSAVPAPEGHPHPVPELHEGLDLLGSAPEPVHADDPLAVHQDAGHAGLHDGALHTTGLHDGAAHHDLDGVGHDPEHLDHTGGHDLTGHEAGHEAAGPEAGHGAGHDTGHDTGASGAGVGDLWFGHGQAAALGAEPPAVHPLAPGPAAHDPFGDSGHVDPWLTGHEDPTAGHAAGTGLDLWTPDQHLAPGHDAGHADAGHDAPQHDLPDDPGHA